MAQKRLSEQRARQVVRDLLFFRGWDTRPVPRAGQVIEESEYKSYPALEAIFKGKSKTGTGIGKPDFLLLESAASLKPLVIIETKPSVSQESEAIEDAIHYGEACLAAGHEVLCVGVAGAEKEICSVIVKRKVNGVWQDLTLHKKPIDWIPSPAQIQVILASKGKRDVAPERPSEEVLTQQANRLNEILRECRIKDEFRPSYAATFMLALWQGEVSVDKSVVLKQINANAGQALVRAKKDSLSQSLRVDAENDFLAAKAWEVVDILKKLNIRSFLQEHDYLGQLYETFFRYTGGNTIGQYFTPRHFIAFITEILQIRPTDVVFDPACGTGGFLIGALNEMIKGANLPYDEAIEKVKSNLFGIETEPATAALCVTNMILRGDGTSGVIKDDCFENLTYPPLPVDFVLMNPPFPHKKSDRPATDFIDRGLQSLGKRGILASIVPYSLLVKTSESEWRKRILKDNTLYFVATLPSETFQPYASYDTAILMIQKGIPHNGKSTFVCRISNDGFKMKKNARVAQSGSQLPLLKMAFQNRTEIAGLCATPAIDETSTEWSPEAFIKSEIYTDESFIDGFEQHLRKHLAFYTMNAHRLLNGNQDAEELTTVADPLFRSKSALSLENIPLGEFKIEDYFDIRLGGKDEIEDLDDGDSPIVSTSEFMNGVTTWKRAPFLFPPPAITVATDGSICSSFVQEFPFYAFYKVAVLTAKEGIEIEPDAYYFVCYLLNRERWRYVYARKFGKGRIGATMLIAPATADEKPDFATMAKLTRATIAYPAIQAFQDAYKIVREAEEAEEAEELGEDEIFRVA